MSRLIEIPDNGIIEFPIMRGEDTIGVERIDLSDYPIVDRPKGKWIKEDWAIRLTDKPSGIKEWTNFFCNICDAPHNSPSDFCPNCGADMREEQNDDNKM